MSDTSQGEGWWQASDGKWYPPQQTGATPPTEAVPPTQPVQPVQPFGSQPVQPFGAPPPGPVGGAPAPGPGPAAAPPGSSSNRGPLIAVIVAVVALVGAIAFFATRDSGSDKKNAAATSSSSTKSSSSSKSTSSSSKSTSSSSAASGAPDIDAPSGFKVFQSDEDQFAIVIPAGMDDVDLTRGDIDQILDDLEKNNPNFANVGPQVRQVLSSGGKLFAIDQASAAATGFAD